MISSSFLAFVPVTALLDVALYVASVVLVVFALLGFASMLVARSQAVDPVERKRQPAPEAFVPRREPQTARSFGKQPLAA